MPGVVVSNVVKRFGSGQNEKPVLDDVSFTAEHGETTVLVGESGCGKTTTLRVIAGLEKETSGEIAIGGRPVNRLEPKDRNIGMVFQNYALYPHMSVFDNIAFGLKIRKTPPPEIDKMVKETLRLLRLEKWIDYKPAQLSGGQRQRVALGRAIVRKPDVLLMDEPLSNLDAKLRAEMRMELKRLQKELGCTMIYVTHDQTEAMTLGSKMVVLNDGRVEQSGRPSDLYAEPDSRFVAGFVGSPGMNFLEGEIRDGKFRSRQIELPAGGIPDGAITVGVRPEDVSVDGHAEDSFDGELTFVEHLGDVNHLFFTSGDFQLVAKRIARTPLPQPGTKYKISFDSSKVHFFDTVSGRRYRRWKN